MWYTYGGSGQGTGGCSRWRSKLFIRVEEHIEVFDIFLGLKDMVEGREPIKKGLALGRHFCALEYDMFLCVLV